MDRHGYVYIMASQQNGTVYIGCTNNLSQRVWQHKQGTADAFTRKCGCKTLVWHQRFENIHDARRREVQMKEWQRPWKLKRIEEMNPDWNDLYTSLI
jgi:putative endonuclease